MFLRYYKNCVVHPILTKYQLFYNNNVIFAQKYCFDSATRKMFYHSNIIFSNNDRNTNSVLEKYMKIVNQQNLCCVNNFIVKFYKILLKTSKNIVKNAPLQDSCYGRQCYFLQCRVFFVTYCLRLYNTPIFLEKSLLIVLI